MPDADRAYFAANPDARASLSRTLHQTAMVPGQGLAASGSLRATEVFLPMCLEADVALAEFAGRSEFSAEVAELVRGWRAVVADMLCLVEAIGGGRRHGLGRAVLHLDAHRSAKA